ncbi:hypothetical protein V2J09_022977 [Rumex salicifolius]
MCQPPCFIHSQYPNHICKLKCSLYRLKQAFAKLIDVLISLVFSPSQSDSSLFTFCSNDILLIASQDSLASTFINSLATLFPVKDMGILHYFLGVEVQHTADGILLNQHKYISD